MIQTDFATGDEKQQPRGSKIDDLDREPNIDPLDDDDDEPEPDPDAPEQDVEDNDDPDHDAIVRRWIEEEKDGGGGGERSPPTSTPN